jgi:serine/threonine protein phosphatase 1
MVMIPEARLPDGVRIYALGDVHGCSRLLRTTMADIEADCARRPIGQVQIVMIGDFVDRGPDSRAVVEWLVQHVEDSGVLAIRGNHDQMLVDFLDDPEGPAAFRWMINGGAETLHSYGVPVSNTPLDPAQFEGLSLALRAAMPVAHLDTLRALPLMHRVGDYVFVHAGVRPGLPIDRQDPVDLLWIRDEFLSSPCDHGAVIVHGHTPVAHIERYPNRISIDTGAVFGGALECLVLEGAGQSVLRADGPHALLT